MKYTEQHIVDFINKKLTDAEMNAFQKELAVNNELLEQVSEKTIEAYGRIKLKNKLDDISRTKKGASVNLKYWLAAAAIALIIGLPIVLKQFTVGAHEELFAEHFKTIKHVPQMYHDVNHPFKKGLVSFDSGNFDEVIEHLNDEIPKVKNDVDDYHLHDAHVYLGLAYLSKSVKEPQKALANFNKAQSYDSSNHDVVWYKALTYMLMNKIDQTKRNLKRLTKTKHPKSKDAKNILNELKSWD